MTIQTDSQKEIVLNKLSSFFNFGLYKDFCLLNGEEFLAKYGYFGFSFSSFVCVRFLEVPDIFKEICNFLPEGRYFIIPVSLEITNIFKMEREEVYGFINQSNLTNFIIFESKLNWLLVYDKYRKLFGLGRYIQHKITTHIDSQAGLRFGKAKLMFWNADTDKIK